MLDLNFLGFHNTKSNDKSNKSKTVHFYIDDSKFEKVWNNPEKYITRLQQYKQVLSPDFSLFTNMPIAL